MTHYIFLPDEDDENKRLDVYLADVIPHLSRSKLQELIKNKNVLINSQSQKSSYKIRTDDKIEVEYNIEKEKEILPEDLPIEIVYEDENMLVVNKPSGMLTHPTTVEASGTLVNALLFKYKENLSDLNGLYRRGIVHRLDRNTSGLLMIAKNNKTHEYLAEQIKQRNITKKYLAIVKGIIKDNEGKLDFPIGRNPKNPAKMCVIETGKASLTEFKVIERFKNTTYLELNLKTGRTHQIRVHLSHIGHPIINDTLYGGGGLKIKTDEQVLQSYKLSFTKPFSCEIINLEIKPDEKIEKVLKYLKNQK